MLTLLYFLSFLRFCSLKKSQKEPIYIYIYIYISCNLKTEFNVNDRKYEEVPRHIFHGSLNVIVLFRRNITIEANGDTHLPSITISYSRSELHNSREENIFLCHILDYIAHHIIVIAMITLRFVLLLLIIIIINIIINIINILLL